jgi:DNA-binding MarR family transcriptional regulator
MRIIRKGDAYGQAQHMTGFMRKVLELIDTGDIVHGRGIAQELQMPYPQTYRVLNVLYARGFLSYEFGEGLRDANRKNYVLTDPGRKLLALAREMSLADDDGKSTPTQVDPEAYSQRMRVAPLLTWLRDLGVVSSYEELKHVSQCTECAELISRFGLRGDVRCTTYFEEVKT